MTQIQLLSTRNPGAMFAHAGSTKGGVAGMITKDRIGTQSYVPDLGNGRNV